MADTGPIHSSSNSATTEDDFVAESSSAFAQQVFQPMFQRAAANPDDVRRLIEEFRDKLDALDLVINTAAPANGRGYANGSAPARAATTHVSNGHSHAANGKALSQPNAHPSNGTAGDAFDDIGRNQRSRLRELTLLEFIARENRPYSLQQILGELNAKGFDDTSGAVVSQLHRLKKTGVIDQPAGGMYEMTDEGLKHLRKLRSSFGSLIAEAR